MFFKTICDIIEKSAQVEYSLNKNNYSVRLVLNKSSNYCSSLYREANTKKIVTVKKEAFIKVER